MSAHVGGGAIGKFAYGLVFVLLWPCLLAAWAFRLDQSAFVTWPVPLAVPVAALALVGGIILIVVAMRALWVHGGGLPMNAFPPRRLVEQSAYRLFTHPIYLGHALAVFGAAALAGSPAGFWIVAPVGALAAVALVLGYEGRAVRVALGRRRNGALFSLPPGDEAAASLATKCAAIVLAWGAWAVVYAVLSQVPTPGAARELRFAFEFDWPLSPAWLWPYSLAYPFAALCPLALRSNADVRRFIIGIWTASVAGFGAMLLWPAKTALLAGDAGTLAALNRHAGRAADAGHGATDVLSMALHLRLSRRHRRQHVPGGAGARRDADRSGRLLGGARCRRGLDAGDEHRLARHQATHVAPVSSRRGAAVN